MAPRKHKRTLNIYFDTDYTIIGVDGSLRPGVEKLFNNLMQSGDHIFIWSGNGIRWKDLDRHKLSHFVTECLEKPLANFKSATEGIPKNSKPDLVIDDNLEIVAALGGVWVNRYYFPNLEDNELDIVGEIIEEVKSRGISLNPRYRKTPIF